MEDKTISKEEAEKILKEFDNTVLMDLANKENVVIYNGLKFEIKFFNPRNGEIRMRLIKENQVKIG